MFTKLSCFTQFKMKVNELIENINMNEGSITGIAKNLNPNKSHGWDNLSIRIIKICGQSIPYPLKLIFIDSLRGGIFLESWKKANIVPVHKKEDKILTNSYRTISLLPILKCLSDLSLRTYLIVLVHCQLGFLPGDSWIS